MRRGGPRTAMMAVGAVLLVVILGWYVLVLRPRAGDVSEAKEQLEQAEGELQSLQATLQQLETIDDDRPELEAELRRLTAAVPPQPELGNMILALHDLAGRSDLAFLAVTPALPAAQEGVAATTIALTLSVEGDFFSVVDFFDRLEDLERIVVVDSITLAAAEPELPTEEEDTGATPAAAGVSSGADVVTLQNGEGAEAIPVTTDAATAGQAPAPGTTVSTAAEPSGTQFRATLLERGGVIRIPSFVISVSVQARMFTTAPPVGGDEGAAAAPAPAPAEGAEGEEGAETTTTTVAAQANAATAPATTTTTARRSG